MRTRLIACLAAVATLAIGSIALQAPQKAEALSPDLPFSADALPTWQTNGTVWQVAISHGKAVVGGTFTQIRPGAGQSGSARDLQSLAILNAATGEPDGCQLPVSFGSSAASVYAVKASPDGDTVFIGGQFTSVGGVSVNRLAEINVQTCTVLPFRVSGISSYVLEIEPSATAVYFGGVFQTVAGQTRRSFAKVDRAGALQTAFVANASGATQDLYSTTIVPGKNARGDALQLSPDGTRLAIGGDWFDVNGSATHSFAVVDSTTGAVLRTWPASTVGPTSRTKTISSDGTRFYVAQEGFNGYDGALAYNWSDYSQAWRDNCAGATQTIVPYQGLLIEAHHHHDCSAQGMYPDGRRIYLTMTHATDPLQTHIGWVPELNDGTGEGIGPRTIAVGTGTDATPYLWVGGEFTRVNGASQQGLTRFNSTDTGAPPAPTIAARAITPGAVQVNIRGVYDPDDSDLTYAVYRGTDTTTPVWTGVAESKHWYRYQATFVDANVTPGTTYSYRVRAIDRANNQSGLSAAATATASSTGSAYASTVIADQPRLFYRYDDTASAQWVVDSAGQTVVGLNGLAQNGVTRTATGAISGDPSGSATFSDTQASGLPQYIWNDVIANGPTVYSVETWFRTTSTTGGALVNYGSSNGRPRTDDGTDRLSTTVDRVVYMENGTGFLRFGVRAGAGTTTLRSTAALNNGQWHHVVATQGPGGMRLYVDGALQSQNSTTGNATYYGTWHVGGDSLSGYPSTGNAQTNRYFDGQLDETAVYYRALSAQQALNHYRVGTGYVDTTAPSVPQGVAAAFDGANVDVSWSAASDDIGVAGYRVYRGTTAGFTPAADTLRATVTTTTFEDVAPAPGTYYYKVIAFDGAGNASAASAASGAATVVDVAAPSVPAGVTATANGLAADVSWTASTDNVGVTGYALYRGQNADFAPSADTLIQPSIAGTAYHDAPLSEGTWYYKVTARDAAGNVSGASSAASVTTVAPDTAAPSVPTGLTATVDAGNNVGLSWSASTDNVGVTGYLVYRGTTPGFTADDASRIGNTTGTTFTDSARPQGTWYYAVAATDAASNVSGASATAAATVSGPAAPPTTQTIVTSADTMAAAVNPTFAYGTTNQLSSRFNTAIESFLRFDLPAAPPGQVLTSATISLRTSTDPTAGSADTHEFRLVTGAWDEATLTWNNRPTAAGPTVLGQLAGATAVNTAYTATLSAADLAPLAGSSITLRLASTAGSDNVRLWSREATVAGFQPTLTLVYTTP
ncbi:LamG-like jellyroll fold domain-containing protein [Leifsonia aquatica]|uniref:Fibronectin type 3 domain-containing protein n=1 Tax=Leifsonia aquatica TaxID=144185 RepID=A0A7W4YLB3_LEIAQ|nr:LamG-like jellyroll fold domain-containing protein [Leifsonia aquatica]MBB2968885.1 fibronectin type 3 domain-containing protein [Leifsonia aquatica]